MHEKYNEIWVIILSDIYLSEKKLLNSHLFASSIFISIFNPYENKESFFRLLFYLSYYFIRLSNSYCWKSEGNGNYILYNKNYYYKIYKIIIFIYIILIKKIINFI